MGVHPHLCICSGFSISEGTQTFTPPSQTNQDWVLFITKGTDLNSGTTLLPVAPKVKSFTVN